MKTYPKLINSGVEWIREIPEHWDLRKVKNSDLIKIASGRFLENYEDGQFPVYGSNGIIGKADLYNVENVIAIGRVGTAGSVIRIPEKAWVTDNGLIVKTSSKINNDFLFYAFTNLDFSRFAQKTAQPLLTQTLLSQFQFCVPPIKEQEKISKFLEKNLKDIDIKISNRQKLIHLLKEKRGSLIHQVLTKGLNLSVPMNDSGIERIGKIPESWFLQKIKHNSYVKGRIGWQGLRSDEFTDDGPYLVTGTDFKNGKINWETCHHVEQWRYDQDSHIQLKENDVLITKDGTIGKVALVEQLPAPTTLNTGVMVIRPLHEKYLPEFLFWILQSQQFTEFIDIIKSGSTINHLYQESFNNFQFTLPKTLEEQQEIINYLNNEISKIEIVISKTKSQIKKLQEYSQSLIFSAVTGKIDVREAIV